MKLLFMRIIKRTLTVFFSFLIFLTLNAQEMGIGQWRDHLPWSYSISVTEAGNIIYCATPHGIIVYDKDENSVGRLTKINGLSDIGISNISYSNAYQTLVIAYSNTNIDLIMDNTIINIPDIKRKQILGNKTINKITLRNEFAYLACGFGIVVLDILKQEIHDTYYIGPDGNKINVLDITFNDTSIFAATESGIYYAPVNDPNLSNFNVWNKIQSINPNVEYKLIHYFNGNLFVNKNSTSATSVDTILVFDGNQWSRFDVEVATTVNNFKSCYGRLVITYNYFVKVFDENLNMLYKIWTYGSSSVAANDAIVDNRNDAYIADRYLGLVRTWSEGWNSQIICPAGPGTIDIFDISMGGGHLWMVSGGYNSSWGNIWKSAIVYSFIDEVWTTYGYWNVSQMDTIRDMVSVAVDPANENHVFAGSWFRGLLEFLNNEMINLYSIDNSSLRPNIFEGNGTVKIGGLYFDSDNNLWATNSGAEHILSRRTPGGAWQSYDLGSMTSGKDVGKTIVDTYNQKWILTRHYQNNPYYMFVFNENNSVGNQSKGLKSGEGNGNIPGNNVFSIAVDQDEEVWIGTDDGVAVFYNPENIFTGSNFDAQRPLVNFDGYVQYLLEGESITAITIDGANRKWMGTDRAGIFLLSEDGTEQIYHFTEENSPLFSNQITDIAINNNTGEVFIGTSKGLIAYKGTATEGDESYGEVYAYPNPVPSGYSGYIGIKGLVKNAHVKITDITGNLIFETIAEGGQAIWNGRDFSGRKANSGVYLVFTSNEDGSETMVTKILFIN